MFVMSEAENWRRAGGRPCVNEDMAAVVVSSGNRTYPAIAVLVLQDLAEDVNGPLRISNQRIFLSCFLKSINRYRLPLNACIRTWMRRRSLARYS